MSERTSKKPGIADYVAAHRKHKDCFLDEIDRLIDWKPLEKVLRQKLKRLANAVGNPAYPLKQFFKPPPERLPRNFPLAVGCRGG